MGRTLLSDAFELVLIRLLQFGGIDGIGIRVKIQIKVKGVGQECPTHTGIAAFPS